MLCFCVLLTALPTLATLAISYSTLIMTSSRYRFTIPAKSVHWDIEWDVKDDSMLLVGCYEHGLGSWDAIKDDPNLSLSKVGEHKYKEQFLSWQPLTAWSLDK